MAHLCLSLGSLLQANPQRTVMTCDGQSTTAAEMHNRVALLSRGLSTQLGISQGDRMVLLGLNTDVFFSSLLAVLDAGAVACPLNWRWSVAELVAALKLLQPKALLVDDHCMPLALQACSTGTCQWRIVSTSACGTQQFSQAAGVLSMQDLMLRPQSCGVQSSSSCSSGAAQAASTQQQQTQGQAAPAAAAQAACPQLQLLSPGQQQPALIVLTSGTTGASKGVMLSHSSLIHQSLAKLAVVQYNSTDTYLHMAPLFHIGGLSSAFAVLLAGGAHVFLPRYSPAAALQLIWQHSVTSLIAVPAMMQDITQAAVAGAGPVSLQQQQHGQMPSLQRVLVGAGGMSLQLQQAVAALFPHADLQTAYGMTEASSSITFISVRQQQQLMAAAAAAGVQQQERQMQQQVASTGGVAAAAAGGSIEAGVGVCVGKPGPGIAVRIDHTAMTPLCEASSSGATLQQQHQQQSDAGVGVVGEVCTRGPHIMLGYWADPAATSRVLDPAGWLHTGDLGYLDSSGHLWLVGRLKDMVKSGGENILAAEVESLLLSHPGVAAAAVIGLPHARLGEQVAAAVVLQQGWGWEGASTVLPLQHAGASLTAATQQQQQQEQQQEQPQKQRVQGTVSAASLQQHCRSSLLSPYKLPRVVVFAQQLPLNSSGKVVKAVLKQQVQQVLQVNSSSAAAGASGSGDSGSSARQQGAPQQLRSRL